MTEDETHRALVQKYELRRSSIHPNYRVPEHQLQNFDKTTTVVMEIEADPCCFIDAQFIIGKFPAGYPMPNNLFGSEAKSRYQKYMDSYRGESPVAVGYGIQLNYLDRAVMASIPIDDVICDPIAPFERYFRLIMCSDVAFPRLEKVLGDTVRNTLRKDLELREFLKEKHYDRFKHIVLEGVSGEPSGTSFEVQPPSPAPSRWENYAGRL
jgi:hypothetical protein